MILLSGPLCCVLLPHSAYFIHLFIIIIITTSIGVGGINFTPLKVPKQCPLVLLVMVGLIKYYYYYRYSALGPVWAETRVQSGDWYGSGTLHPGHVLRGSLPLLSPNF